MSRTAAQANGAAAGARVVAGMVFVAVLALVVLLLVRARPSPDPFDPRSGRPDGALGLVLTLERLGAVVDDTRDVPAPGAATVVLVLDDRLDDEQRNRLLDFVEAGGTAVVADPASTLHGGVGTEGGAEELTGRTLPQQRLPPEAERNLALGDCTLHDLAGLRGLYVPDGLLFPVGPDDAKCFARGGTSFVIAAEFGSGRIVGLGDNEIFVNRHLRRADNAGLAARLLANEPGTNVTFLLGRGASPTVADVGSGDERLLDLVAPWVWMSIVLGAIAFVVFAISRSARVGRIVSEPIAVPVAGSELVAATGNLMARAGHASRSGWLVLGRLHRDLCRIYAVDVNAPLAELDRVVAERGGTRPGEVEALLRTVVHDSGALVALQRRIDHLRHETTIEKDEVMT